VTAPPPSGFILKSGMNRTKHRPLGRNQPSALPSLPPTRAARPIYGPLHAPTFENTATHPRRSLPARLYARPRPLCNLLRRRSLPHLSPAALSACAPCGMYPVLVLHPVHFRVCDRRLSTSSARRNPDTASFVHFQSLQSLSTMRHITPSNGAIFRGPAQTFTCTIQLR